MDHHKYPFLLAYLMLAGLAFVHVAGADQNADQGEHAVRAAAREYVTAVQRGDADTLAKMWTSDGDYVDSSGQVFKAKGIIHRQPVAPWQKTDSADLSLPKSSLRFITTDVAIEDGASQFGVYEDGRALLGRFTAVWVKRDGRWLLDSLRESVSSSPPPENHLQPLSWLLGEWAGAADDAVVLVSSHWSDGGKYIVREFLVRSDGREDISGSQRIGWDSATGKIRCWTFDSQGGSGTGFWRRDGDRWIVESKDVMGDGKKSTSSAVYVPAGDGSFTWETTSGEVAGTKLPAVRVEFRRAAESE